MEVNGIVLFCATAQYVGLVLSSKKQNVKTEIVLKFQQQLAIDRVHIIWPMLQHKYT
jgi:hypothetical protein